MSPEELSSRLRQLGQRTSALRVLVEQVQTHAPTAATVATDPSGSVHVEVQPDGVPRVIRVEPDWQHRTEPARLAAGVLAAYQAAAGTALQALDGTLGNGALGAHARDGALGDGGRRSGISGVRSGQRDDREPEPTPPSAPAPDRPRDPLILTEQILKALHAVRTRATAPAPMYEGHGGRGALSVTLSPAGGLYGCAIEPAWAARQSATTLNAALRDALDSARERFSADVSARKTETAMLDALAGEALATLAQVTRATPPPREP